MQGRFHFRGKWQKCHFSSRRGYIVEQKDVRAIKGVSCLCIVLMVSALLVFPFGVSTYMIDLLYVVKDRSYCIRDSLCYCVKYGAS